MVADTHARVRRHFKCAHLHKPEASTAALRRVKFINGKFRTMRVAAGINEQVAKQTVYEPRRRLIESSLLPVHFLERDFEFVKRIVARLVNTWRLRRRTDKQSAEHPAQRRMILPIPEQRAQ